MTGEPNIVERLRMEHDRLDNEAAAEIERCWELLKGPDPHYDMARENGILRAALEPFARNVDAISLMKALGHIEREHLHAARAALEQKS